MRFLRYNGHRLVFFGFLSLLIMLATPTQSEAVPSQLLPSAQTTDMLVVDPINGGPATAAVGAFAGNDKPANALTQLNDNDVFNLDMNWTFAGSSDGGGNGPFTSNPETTSGVLEFDDPITSPFVIALKSSNAFSLYYFANGTGDTSLLTFTTNGVGLNKHGKPQGLSHASLYLASQDNTPPPPPVPPLLPPVSQPPVTAPVSTPSNAIPEPGTATLALLGTLALLRRSRRSQLR